MTPPRGWHEHQVGDGQIATYFGHHAGCVYYGDDAPGEAARALALARRMLDRPSADPDDDLAILTLAETAITDSDLREAIGWVVTSWEKGRVSTAALRHLQTIYRRGAP